MIDGILRILSFVMIVVNDYCNSEKNESNHYTKIVKSVLRIP